MWNKVLQTARSTVASYEGSMLSSHTKKVSGYQWDDKFEGTQGVKYLLYIYILQNVKVYSHQWQWITVQGQITLLTQVSMHFLGTISKA